MATKCSIKNINIKVTRVRIRDGKHSENPKIKNKAARLKLSGNMYQVVMEGKTFNIYDTNRDNAVHDKDDIILMNNKDGTKSSIGFEEDKFFTCLSEELSSVNTKISHHVMRGKAFLTHLSNRGMRVMPAVSNICGQGKTDKEKIDRSTKPVGKTMGIHFPQIVSDFGVTAYIADIDGDKKTDYARFYFNGFLIDLDRKTNRLVIYHVWAKSPAKRAGLRKGDMILGFTDGLSPDKQQLVDDVFATCPKGKEEKLDCMKEVVRGPFGSWWNLKILRKENDGTTKILEIPLVRQMLPLPSYMMKQVYMN